MKARRVQVISVRAPRGFTLLEILLAVAVLSVLSVLIAAMWAQTRDWSLENAAAQRTLRLPRALDLVRSQWADRRAATGVGRITDGVSVGPDEVAFVTAAPVLFSDWPLVMASWRVERDDDLSPPGEDRWMLVYRETVVDDLRTDDERDRTAGREMAADRRLRIEPRELIVLGGCPRLSIERFGPEFRRGTESTPGAQGPAASGDEREREEWIAFGPDEWRPIDAEFDGVPPAVRLVGVFEGKEFSCVLVVGASR